MNLDKRIKLRHLNCFLEVARQRSFVKAAAVLAVSQPAASKTIQELERILAARLFDRTPDGVELSEAGRLFLRYIGPGVAALRRGVAALSDGSHEQALPLRLGVLSTAESALVPEAIRQMYQRHPHIAVRVATGPAAYLLPQLRLGELDLVVGRVAEAPDIQGLAFEHLYDERMLFVVRPEHPLLGAALSDLARLADYPLVLPLPETVIRRHVDSFFVQWGVELPQARVETLSTAVSRSYVVGSDAIWIAPADAVAREIAAGTLARLPLPVEEPGGSVGLCWNPEQAAATAAELFRELLRGVAAELRASNRL